MKGLARIPTKKTDKFCPKHPKTRLIYYEYENKKKHVHIKLAPFCLKCIAEQTEEEKKEHDWQVQKDTAKSYLRGYSLVDNPEQFKKTFSNFKAAKGSKQALIGNAAYKIAKEYIEKPNEPLKTIMYGLPGEGKSHLAMAMLNLINEKSNPPQNCLFIDISELFKNWKESFNNPHSKWSEDKIDELLGAPRNKEKYIGGTDVLVLDDLGSESSMRSEATEATDRKQDIIKGILDRQQRIIVTTNLTLEQLKQVYNPKIISRLLWHSEGRRLDFTGIKDKRGF